MRDLLSIRDLTADEILTIIQRARWLKEKRQKREPHRPLEGRTLGMIFEKASTRTRVSFEVGMFELGGLTVLLQGGGSQLGRGEPIRDTARVLGSYCDGLVIRTFGQERAEELARYCERPVINGLTDHEHPCQVLADLMTVAEEYGDVRGVRYAWIGDGNNMAHSWIHAAAVLGLDLALACPYGYDPDPRVLALAERDGRGRVGVVRVAAEAVHGRQVVNTDVWASMGEEAEQKARERAFRGFCLDEALMAEAAKDSIVLHCLPAHRGEEISEGVLEGAHSRVWRQAENRLHVQKAILEILLLMGAQ